MLGRRSRLELLFVSVATLFVAFLHQSTIVAGKVRIGPIYCEKTDDDRASFVIFEDRWPVPSVPGSDLNELCAGDFEDPNAPYPSVEIVSDVANDTGKSSLMKKLVAAVKLLQVS